MGLSVSGWNFLPGTPAVLSTDHSAQQEWLDPRRWYSGHRVTREQSLLPTEGTRKDFKTTPGSTAFFNFRD